VSVIKSKLNTRSEEFKANSAAMNALVADLREKTIAVSAAVRRKRRPSTRRAASCCRASASTP
jgi:hypothetical protein